MTFVLDTDVVVETLVLEEVLDDDEDLVEVVEETTDEILEVPHVPPIGWHPVPQ